VVTERFGWTPVDAMEADVRSVAGKVRAKLAESDCVIADVSLSSPNVMFEVGHAFALRHPVVLLLNLEAFDDPAYRAYFDLLGHSRARPLAADLGDREYLLYPTPDAPPAAWTRFEDELAAKLERLREHFTPEVRLLRRSARRFYATTFEFMEAHRPSNPIIGFLAGRLHYSADGLRAGGTHVFVTLAQYYAEAMKAFAGATPDGGLRTVRAIADLSQTAESLWTGTDDPLGVHIRERVFVVPTARFFDDRAMERLAGIFREQGRKHEVCAVPFERIQDLRNPLEGAISHDMLLMEPDVAGGYVHRVLGAQNVPHLYVKRGDDDYRRASEFYDAVRARAFSVRGVKRGADVVRAWLGHTGTGTWQPHWLAHVETRPPEYFSEYDNNIRCWVPAYDQLIQQTGDIVCHLLLERLRRTAAPLALLELGCGTGALTEVLARWVEQIDAPHRNVRRPSVVDRLVALDPATPMRAETSRRIEGAFKGTPPFLHVSHGRAPDSFPSTVDDRRYDVICGSLVLHDVLAGRRSCRGSRRGTRAPSPPTGRCSPASTATTRRAARGARPGGRRGRCRRTRASRRARAAARAWPRRRPPAPRCTRRAGRGGRATRR
jgi:SAM-dependent methyltransferase